MSRLRKLGPGLLVTAAFIGPGTVTVASTVGAGYGFVVGWALVFSVVATIVLQEMSARLGIVSRAGLGEAVRRTFTRPVPRALAALLVVAAIGLGNAAYQASNLLGAATALESLLGLNTQLAAGAIGLAALLLLASGAYRWIERVLISLVVLMSVVFLTTAVMVRPDLGKLAAGLVTPVIPPGGWLPVLGLIGTTVVPYNLFLHASSVCEKWPADVERSQALGESRLDTTLAIILGGLVTLAIMTTAAAAFAGTGIKISSAAHMAPQLEPLLGGAAPWFFGIGLLAAGLTSAITAPLAASYAVAGVCGWPREMRSWPFRAVWFLVLATGVVTAMGYGESPVEMIIFAQVANGLLLPLVATLLIVVVNRRDLLGEYRNGWPANGAAVVVVLIVTLLGGLGVYKGITSALATAG